VKPLPDPISSLLLYTYLPLLFFPLSVLQHQKKQEDHPGNGFTGLTSRASYHAPGSE
jgi:hypothetical protein